MTDQKEVNEELILQCLQGHQDAIKAGVTMDDVRIEVTRILSEPGRSLGIKFSPEKLRDIFLQNPFANEPAASAQDTVNTAIANLLSQRRADAMKGIRYSKKDDINYQWSAGKADDSGRSPAQKQKRKEIEDED